MLISDLISDTKEWPLNSEIIKEKLEDLKKNDKISPMHRMILKTLLFAFIGQLVSFLTLTQHYLTQAVFKSKSRTIIMILFIFQFSLIGLGMIILKRKIIKPKPIYLIISLIYIATIVLSLFGYKEDKENHMLVVFIWSLISISVYSSIISKAQFKLNQLIGFVLSIIGLIIIISFILYSVIYNELLFFNDDFKNNFIAILHGIAFAAALVLQEQFLKKEEEVYAGLMWIGISSLGLMSILTLIAGDYSLIYSFFKELDSIDFLRSSGAVLTGVIMYTIMPFYINKCSSFVLCLSLNTQLYWKFVIDMILNDFDQTLLWNTFGVIILLI